LNEPTLDRRFAEIIGGIEGLITLTRYGTNVVASIVKEV
jgi:hypothetical protein